MKTYVFKIKHIPITIILRQLIFRSVLNVATLSLEKWFNKYLKEMKKERKLQITNDPGMILQSDVISWTTLKYKLDSGPQEKDLESDQKCPIVTF